MAHITREQVQHLAHLARLDIADDLPKYLEGIDGPLHGDAGA